MDLSAKDVFEFIIKFTGALGIGAIINNTILNKTISKNKYNAAIRLIDAFEKNNDHLLQIEYYQLFKKLPPQPEVIKYLLSQPGKLRNLILYAKYQHNLNWKYNSLQIRHKTFFSIFKRVLNVLQYLFVLLLITATLFVLFANSNDHIQNVFYFCMWFIFAVSIAIAGTTTGKQLNAIYGIEELVGKL